MRDIPSAPTYFSTLFMSVSTATGSILITVALPFHVDFHSQPRVDRTLGPLHAFTAGSSLRGGTGPHMYVTHRSLPRLLFAAKDCEVHAWLWRAA